MTTTTDPSLILYGHWAAPNPFKVVLILKELGLPYEYRKVEFSDVKKPEYTSINPNGRLPALIDNGTGLTIWESGAIIVYLIEQYDKEGKISFRDVMGEKYACLQWLMFQVSGRSSCEVEMLCLWYVMDCLTDPACDLVGQGPYSGQATWFVRFHHEKVQSASDRYVAETIRIIEVLDKALSGRKWLVGEKCTYADLSFVTWAHVVRGLLDQVGKAEIFEKASNYSQWLSRLEQRESVKEVVEIMSRERAAHGLPP